MGYYTSYKLKIFESDRHQLNLFENNRVEWSPEIEEAYKNCPGVAYALNEDGSSYEQVKWYEHDTDMLAYSKKYPNLVFQLFGEGEESGDIWCSYYYNGKKIYYKMPEWVPPEFDKKQLT
jgi:hypothetical protein